jgi:hypothetical protein
MEPAAVGATRLSAGCSTGRPSIWAHLAPSPLPHARVGPNRLRQAGQSTPAGACAWEELWRWEGVQLGRGGAGDPQTAHIHGGTRSFYGRREVQRRCCRRSSLVWPSSRDGRGAVAASFLLSGGERGGVRLPDPSRSGAEARGSSDGGWDGARAEAVAGPAEASGSAGLPHIPRIPRATGKWRG